MAKQQDRVWKDALLKSSLPLEHLIAQKLLRQKFMVWGEYSYVRQNEENLDTEFSIDVRATQVFQKRKEFWSELNLLVECKYSHPNVKWVFAPHPDEFAGLSPLNKYEELSTRAITDTSRLYDFSRELLCCNRGVILHESDAYAQGVFHGLFQLRYASLQQAIDLVQIWATVLHDEELLIGFVCPILVTTASLYVLKANKTLQHFQNASALDQVARPVRALIVDQANTPQTTRHIATSLKKLHTECPKLRTRLDQLSMARKALKPGKKGFYTADDFEDNLETAMRSVLVVNFDAFDQVVRSLRESVRDSGRALRRFAMLKAAARGNYTWIDPA